MSGKADRQARAKERKEARDKLTAEEQLAILATRPGLSSREIERLKKSLSK